MKTKLTIEQIHEINERSRTYAIQQMDLIRQAGGDNPFRVEYEDDNRPVAVRGGNAGEYNPK